MGTLQGKRALVTGATQGIGNAIARELVELHGIILLEIFGSNAPRLMALPFDAQNITRRCHQRIVVLSQICRKCEGK